MAPWIFIGVAVALLGVTLRQWLEYGQRQRQLAAELHRLRSLIEDHTEKLERVRASTTSLENETKTLTNRREDLKAQVLVQRETLTDLEERLERVRPKSHRIDNKSRDGEDELF